MMAPSTVAPPRLRLHRAKDMLERKRYSNQTFRRDSAESKSPSTTCTCLSWTKRCALGLDADLVRANTRKGMTMTFESAVG